jgi:hypothetical protein
MSRASLALTFEIEKLTIVIAEKVPLTSLLTRKTKSKFTGEMVTYQRKTPFITQDSDTVSFIKYLLHHKIKERCFQSVRYDETTPFKIA